MVLPPTGYTEYWVPFLICSAVLARGARLTLHKPTRRRRQAFTVCLAGAWLLTTVLLTGDLWPRVPFDIWPGHLVQSDEWGHRVPVALKAGLYFWRAPLPLAITCMAFGRDRGWRAGMGLWVCGALALVGLASWGLLYAIAALRSPWPLLPLAKLLTPGPFLFTLAIGLLFLPDRRRMAG